MDSNNNNNNNNNNEDINLSQDQLGEILDLYSKKNSTTENLDKALHLIRSYNKKPECVFNYIYHITTNKNEQNRKLAAVLLAKKITKHYESFNENNQKEIIKALINSITNDKYLVAKSVGIIIYKIISFHIKNNKPTELIDFIFMTDYNEKQITLCEVNLYIISELLENFSSEINQLNKLSNIKIILKLSLKSNNKRMKENATRCLGSLIRSSKTEEIQDLKELGKYVFDNIENFDDSIILHIYETFTDFSTEAIKFFDSDFDQIVNVTFTLIVQIEISNLCKMVMIEFINMILEVNKKIFTKNNKKFLNKAIEVSFLFMSTEEDVNEYSIKESSCYDLGIRLLQLVCTYISSKTIYPVIKQGISSYINDKNDSFKRKAAIAAIGCLLEGCEEKIREDIDDYINLIINTFKNDENTIVRSECILTLDSIIEMFPEEVSEYHKQILPMFEYGISKINNEDTVQMCLVELKFFVEKGDFEIDPYLNIFIPILINHINNSKILIIQSKALGALSAFINVSDENLDKFDFVSLLKTCHNILNRNNNNNITNINKEDESDLKCNALKCSGEIAFNIGLEKFNEYLSVFTPYAVEYIQKINEYVLVEAGFYYFGAISKILGEKIQGELRTLMTKAHEVIRDESGIEKPEDKDEYAMDSDSEIEEGKEEYDGNVFNSDYLNCKAATICATTQFALACPNDFTRNHMQDLLNDFEYFWDRHVLIDSEMIKAYETLIKSQVKNKMDDAKLTWNKIIFFKLESTIKEADFDKQSLVISCLDAIYGIIDIMSVDAFIFENKPNNILERLMEIVYSILEKKLDCQIVNEDDDEDEEDDEEGLLKASNDIFLIVAEKLGNDFHDTFSKMTQYLNKYLSPKRNEFDRSLVFACYAEVLKYCKVSTKFYIDDLFKYIEKSLEKAKKESKKNNLVCDELLRNISYLIGNLFESDPNTAKDKLDISLKMLEYITKFCETNNNIINNDNTNTNNNNVDEEEDDFNSSLIVKDNVIAAYCKICYSLSLDVNSDIFKKLFDLIFANMPFKHDHNENLCYIEFIKYLSNKITDVKDFKVLLPKFMTVFKTIIIDKKKVCPDDKHIKEIKVLLESYNNNNEIKDLLTSMLNNTEMFSEKQKNTFIKELS